MQTLVINRACDRARMDFQKEQLSRLGLPFERLEAITPETLKPSVDDPYWQTWQRPMKDVEKALVASHCRAWERVAEADGPLLVLEDDALLSAAVPGFLEQIRAQKDMDHVTLETRARKKLVSRRAHPDVPVRRLRQDYSGAAAYVLWPRGALVLLEDCRTKTGLADAVICSAYRLQSWQAWPALAIQIDQCAHYEIKAPIAVQSAPLSAPEVMADPTQLTHYRKRRKRAQMAIITQRLRHGLSAWRCDVPLAADVGA